MLISSTKKKLISCSKYVIGFNGPKMKRIFNIMQGRNQELLHICQKKIDPRCSGVCLLERECTQGPPCKGRNRSERQLTAALASECRDLYKKAEVADHQIWVELSTSTMCKPTMFPVLSWKVRKSNQQKISLQNRDLLEGFGWVR